MSEQRIYEEIRELIAGREELRARLAASEERVRVLTEALRRLSQVSDSIWIQMSDGEAKQLRDAWSPIDEFLSPTPSEPA